MFSAHLLEKREILTFGVINISVSGTGLADMQNAKCSHSQFEPNNSSLVSYFIRHRKYAVKLTLKWMSEREGGDVNSCA